MKNRIACYMLCKIVSDGSLEKESLNHKESEMSQNWFKWIIALAARLSINSKNEKMLVRTIKKPTKKEGA